MKEKVVLAYSGGLDTTALIPWLKETFDYEVICCCVNCGQGNELDGLDERAKLSGASKLYIEDIVDDFCDNYVMPCVQAGAVYEHKYLLGTSMARPAIAKKLVEIASQLNISPGTVRGWKSKDSWNDKLIGTFQKNTERSKRKRGGQPGNKNAVGGPPGNKKAEKYGFFSKYLPDETKEIFDAIEHADPLDLLWHQIQIAYAAIVRAQRIAYVKDHQDRTINKIGEKDGETVSEERWEVQEAWDKQNNFLKAQARAQAELSRMIKQYDEMLHANWDLATEEQKTRLQVMKTKAQLNDEEGTVDDGFLEALNTSAAEDWKDEETGI